MSAQTKKQQSQSKEIGVLSCKATLDHKSILAHNLKLHAARANVDGRCDLLHAHDGLQSGRSVEQGSYVSGAGPENASANVARQGGRLVELKKNKRNKMNIFHYQFSRSLLLPGTTKEAVLFIRSGLFFGILAGTRFFRPPPKRFSGTHSRVSRKPCDGVAYLGPVFGRPED